MKICLIILQFLIIWYNFFANDHKFRDFHIKFYCDQKPDRKTFNGPLKRKVLHKLLLKSHRTCPIQYLLVALLCTFLDLSYTILSFPWYILYFHKWIKIIAYFSMGCVLMHILAITRILSISRHWCESID